MLDNISTTLSKYAPTIASALLSPFSNVALDLILKTLKLDKKEQIKPKLKKDPKAIKKIKKLEKDYQNIFLINLANENTANARSNHKNSIIPAFVTFIVSFMLSVFVWYLVNQKMVTNETILLILGQILTVWQASVAYWVGTSKFSQSKPLK